MKKLLRLLVLNGPNLNMLGVREPATYGKSSLKDVEALCSRAGKAAGFNVDCRQTNLEGELVSWIQQAKATYAGIIINAGGYSHSSVAILDALLLVKLPIIEVHISNIYAREEFRHNSLVSRAASGVICGLGINGYSLAIRACAEILNLSKR